MSTPRHHHLLLVPAAALVLLCGCTPEDSHLDDRRAARAASPGDATTDTYDATDTRDQDAIHLEEDTDADTDTLPGPTPLPPPPGQPEAFEFECPVAEPSEEFRQWLDDHAHCHGQGDPLFEDVTLEAGVIHVHDMPEDLTMYRGLVGGGAVLEDLTNDGAVDLYLSNAAGPNSFLVNDGTGSFRDCTAQTDLGFAQDWTNGVSAADYDNDGWPDLYLANRGPDRLIRNNGDGTFSDVTEPAGISADGNSATASWGDLDGDGHLEVLVSTLAWDVDLLGRQIEPGDSRLFHNRGDSTFVDVTDQTGLRAGSSFVTPMLDLDNDGDLDILSTQEFVDYAPHQLLRNDGTNTDGELEFTDVWTLTSVPLTNAVMGIGVFDSNRDGLLDLAASNLWGVWPFREAFLENQGDLDFVDAAPDRGASLMDASYSTEGKNRLVSWAMVPINVDNDADDDLYVSYGHFKPGYDLERTPSEYPPYAPRQANGLMLDRGDGQFELREGSCAEDTGRSRAAVAGDVDADGCLDLVVVNQDGAVRLLRNRCESGNSHMSIELVGTTSNRDAVGARVAVSVGGRTSHRRITAGSNLHSAGPRKLHFGLGDAHHADHIDILWPSGAQQRFRQVHADSIVLEEPSLSD